jgi:mono/diheme cytochrome c family protein
VHRALGYLFVLIYVALLFEMVPRLWEFRVSSGVAIAHAVVGAVVGLLLIVKIAIIRRYRSAGRRLPLIGGTLAVAAVAMNAVALVPVWIALRPLAKLTPELAAGRDVVAAKCFQCHGASTIISEREDARKWDRLTRKMQRFSQRIPGKEAITEPERLLAAAYLTQMLGEREDGDDDHDDEAEDADDDDGGGGRGRGRGRGRGGRDR